MQLVSKSLPPSEAEAFQKALEQYPPRCVRIRPDRADSTLPFSASVLPWNAFGRVLDDSQIRPSQFLQYAVGDYYIQEAGSLLAVTLAETQPDDVVCDLCAAPGGKASAMLEALTGNGALVANEVIASRVAVLKYNLARCGNPRFVVTNQDTGDLVAGLRNKFDLVMVDAPCSGQTLTIKNKRSDNAFDSRHVEHAAARQRRILRDAVQMLKVGGRLVYSTCTFADQENEDQIIELVESFPSSLRVFPSERLAEYESPLYPGCYRLWPHRHPSAGSFAARLLKVDDVDIAEAQQTRPQKKRHAERSEKQRMDPSAMLAGFGRLSEMDLAESKGNVYAMKGSAMDRLRDAFDSGAVPVVGLPTMVSMAKNSVVPSHELALLAGGCFSDYQSIDLNDALAVRAAAGGTIDQRELSLTLSDAVSSEASKYRVAMWNGRPFGWLKIAGNRLNNLIPPIARLSLGGHP